MSHQDRREPLPKGYQFGDASLNARMGAPFGPELTPESRAQLTIWDRNRREPFLQKERMK